MAFRKAGFAYWPGGSPPWARGRRWTQNSGEQCGEMGTHMGKEGKVIEGTSSCWPLLRAVGFHSLGSPWELHGVRLQGRSPRGQKTEQLPGGFLLPTVRAHCRGGSLPRTFQPLCMGHRQVSEAQGSLGQWKRSAESQHLQGAGCGHKVSGEDARWGSGGAFDAAPGPDAKPGLWCQH